MHSEIVILDDEEMVCSIWERRCRQANRTIKIFRTRKEILKAIPSISYSALVFLDKNINGKPTGIALSQQLANRGFQNIYISTAEPHSAQKPIRWIKGYVGKTPPAWIFQHELTSPLSHTERTNLIAKMSAQQLALYKNRMTDFLNISHGTASGALPGPDLDGFNLPEVVMTVWEKAITLSLSDEEIKDATDQAWRLS